MVTHGRVELLAHPLSQKYLQMKWNAYGKYFHVTNLLIYTVFLSFVTIYASQMMQSVDTNNTSLDQTKNDTQNSTAEVRNYRIVHYFLCFLFDYLISFVSRKVHDLCIQGAATID